MMSDPQLTGYFANFMVEVSREHTDERLREEHPTDERLREEHPTDELEV
jgi:ubiquinone biosynthesis protein